MPGIIIEYQVKIGDEINVDDPVVILEAMKMTNSIFTPVSGRVKTINFKSGDNVNRGDILAVIQ
jgi:pyruvate carboxylase subunit B